MSSPGFRNASTTHCCPAFRQSRGTSISLHGIAVTPSYPDVHDDEGWRQHIATVNASFEPLWAMLPRDPEISTTQQEIEGVPVVAAKLANPIGGDHRVHLDIHGGALIYLASLIHDARFRVRSGHLLRLAVLRGRPASLAFVSPHSD